MFWITEDALDALVSQIYFWNKNSTCFGQFLCPSSGVFHCTHSNTYRFAEQTCMPYTIAMCTVKNS